MYRKIKSAIRNNFSEKWIQKNELWLRAVYARYCVSKGDCLCSVCGQSLKAFVAIEKNELLCPACGSGKRHRKLFLLLRKKWFSEAPMTSILDFSPNKGFAHYAHKLFGKAYETTNFEEEDKTDFHYDITKIAAKDNAFDLIICYHVLEHIPEDQIAMAELFRILKPGGFCYIQTPFKSGEIYEDFGITAPKERLKHFEQEDHVRIYSAKGLADRLQNAGFHTKILHYKQEDNPLEAKKYGFKDEEFILLAGKPK